MQNIHSTCLSKLEIAFTARKSTLRVEIKSEHQLFAIHKENRCANIMQQMASENNVATINGIIFYIKTKGFYSVR